ncbi:MAG TPA: phage holin family protein [Gaiellaceae bacterium]
MSDTDRTRSEQGLGQLAHELSLLVRADLELSAAERLPELRRLTLDSLGGLVLAVASLLALAALSFAAGLGLAQAVQPWLAGLIVAAGWGAVAGAIVLLGHPRRLAQRLEDAFHQRLIEQARVERRRAEEAVRRTAEGLAREMAQEAAEHEAKEALSALERELGSPEADRRLAELVRAVTAPGRAGLDLIERIAGVRPPDEAGGGRRPSSS